MPETYSVPSQATATCSTCGKTFIPPVLPSRRGGDATTCRGCAQAAWEAEQKRGRDAYTAMNTTGIVNR